MSETYTTAFSPIPAKSSIKSTKLTKIWNERLLESCYYYIKARGRFVFCRVHYTPRNWMPRLSLTQGLTETLGRSFTVRVNFTLNLNFSKPQTNTWITWNKCLNEIKQDNWTNKYKLVHDTHILFTHYSQCCACFRDPRKEGLWRSLRSGWVGHKIWTQMITIRGRTGNGNTEREQERMTVWGRVGKEERILEDGVLGMNKNSGRWRKNGFIRASSITISASPTLDQRRMKMSDLPQCLEHSGSFRFTWDLILGWRSA